MNIEKLKVNSWDERRQILIPGDELATLDVSVRHFVSEAREAIQTNGAFRVALSGGNTPKKIFEKLSQPPYKEQIDWSKVWLFWSDERSVPPENEESNYKMAMDSGLKSLPIPKQQIHRMVAEDKIEENALKYEQLLKSHPLDLVMLGMGEDGHTASLFPSTEGLKATDRLVIANYVPQKNTWRMSLTFDAINSAKSIAIYVIGASKKHTLKEVFSTEENPDRFPIQKIGNKEHKALWIIDEAAGAELMQE